MDERTGRPEGRPFGLFFAAVPAPIAVAPSALPRLTFNPLPENWTVQS